MKRFALWIILLALSASGCSRAYYRRQADEQAHALVREKASHPHWSLDEFHVYVDPRSRMFDPFSPDKPPLPPDDPAAHRLMHKVDGKKGYPRWHANGDTDGVENPTWIDYLPLDENGVLELDEHQILAIGRMNSRTYQQEVEELYLSALDVSFERFRFDSQFFAGYQANFVADGKDRTGGGGDSKSTFTAGTYANGRNASAWTWQRSFTTGADLVVGFANSLVWQFSGPNNYQGTTLLDFSLVQPLLRSAGRDRVMERLTVAERTLLANVRAMERYRREFYVDLMTGRNVGQGPSRRGGVLGSGLEGFTGLGVSGFGNVSTTTGAGAGNAGGQNTGAGAAAVGGYLGLLQQQQQIHNQEDNITRLRANLFRLEVGLEEMLTTIPLDQEQIPRQRLQVAQARQALFVAESRLLNSRNQFQSQLDTYKVQLGLPPEICVKVDASLLDQFQLIDDKIKPRQDRIEEIIREVGETNAAILGAATEEKDAVTNMSRRALAWTQDLREGLEKLREQMEPAEAIAKELVQVNLNRAAEDLEKLKASLPRRRVELHRLREKYDQQGRCVCPLLPVPELDVTVFDTTRLDKLVEKLSAELDRLRIRLAEYDGRMEEFYSRVDRISRLSADVDAFRRFEQVRDEAVLASQDILTDLRIDILALELLQVRARTESIELVPIDLMACDAMSIAAKYRRDLMNARASLVDSWRLIEFNADNLESSLDILFSGDISNTGQNPLQLNDSTGRLKAGVRFDAPLTRLSERNTYRQALIEYQQARRNFYTFEDQIARSLRTTLRTIETNQLNFELQRYAVLVAAEQIDLNEDIRVLREALRQPSGATAARDSVSALTDLLNAQNDFLSVWINYEAQRRILELDLDTMQLNEDGTWIDPGAIRSDYEMLVAERLGTCEPPVGVMPCEHEVEAEEIFPAAPQARTRSRQLPAASTVRHETEEAAIAAHRTEARRGAVQAAPFSPNEPVEPIEFPPSPMVATRRNPAMIQPADDPRMSANDLETDNADDEEEMLTRSIRRGPKSATVKAATFVDRTSEEQSQAGRRPKLPTSSSSSLPTKNLVPFKASRHSYSASRKGSMYAN